MSDDRDWRQYTRRGALGLMGVGGLAVATETMGITQLRTDRDTAIDTAGDAASDVGLQVTPSNENVPIDEGGEDKDGTYTGTEEFQFDFTNKTSNNTLSAENNDLSVTLDATSSGKGDEDVNIDTTTNLTTDFNGPIESGDLVTFNLANDLGNNDTATLGLSISDPSDPADREAMDIGVTTNVDFGDTTVEFTRSITIEDQSA